MNGLAPAVPSGTFPNDPALFFKTMKRCDQSGFFDGEVLRDLGLSKRFPGAGKMEKRAPACLAQSHGLESFVQLETPGARGAAENETEVIRIEFFHMEQTDSLAA
jgi:hypothetical protein